MLLQILTVVGVFVFSGIVLFVGRLTFLDREPHHSNWLSFAGGVAIAYCLTYLLPKLASQQNYLEVSTDGGVLGFMEHHVYLVATAGLVLYFGLNRGTEYMTELSPVRKRYRMLKHVVAHADVTGATAYFLLIGYLLTEKLYLSSLLLFTFGLGLHVLGLSHVFRERYPGGYDARIRWYFAGAIVVGGGIGWTTNVSEVVLAVFTAFLGGAIIATAFREELPQQSKLRFWPFFMGVTIFVIASLLVEWLEKGAG
jgi:hypothetical protein